MVMRVASCRTMIRALWCTVFLAALALAGPCHGSQDGIFPVYDAIRPNVAFWKAVYSRYTSSQGLLHDSENLSVIYEVLALEDRWERSSRKRNQRKVRRAKEKYRRILLRLAQGQPPQNPEEQRVASLFAGERPERLKEAAANIRFQVGQSDLFRQGVIRSGAWIERIKAILASHGLPRDLAYLPFVESSYNPRAYSKFGAAGIWQFTRSTGKRFMTIDYVVDERRDPIVSTHAAARLLKENYEKLGSWPLAITAYNHGVNGMLRAKERKGGYEAVFQEYDGRLFGFASRNFYPEFLAAREVAKHYTRYFGDLSLDQPPAAVEVVLEGFAPAQELARHFGVPLDVLRQWNLSLREPVFQGQKYVPKGFCLRLPATLVASAKADIPPEMYRPHQKRSRFYLVQRGDTASRIARLHGVRLQDLILANGLDARATIYAGQNLRIPQPGDRQVVELAKRAKKPAGSAQLASLVPVGIPAAEGVKPSPPEAPEVADGGGEQPDGQAETLGEPETIGDGAKEQEYPVPPLLVAASRERDSGDLHPARLALEEGNRMPQPEQEDVGGDIASAPVNPEVVMGRLKVEKVFWRDGKEFGVIRVEPEETLGHYAEWLGVRARDLRALNGLRYGRPIRLGQRIRIPLDAVGREEFEESRYLFHKELEEDFFTAYRVESLKRYQVQPGDNIWELCRTTFELPFWVVRKFNPKVDFLSLKPGDLLVVPEVEKQE